MRRLYWRVYLAILAILVGCFAVASLAWWVLAGGHGRGAPLEPAAAVAGLLLGEPLAGPLAARLERLAVALDADLGVFEAGGEPLAAVGGALPGPDPTRGDHHWVHRRWGERPAAAIRLDDGRWLVARAHRPPRPPGRGLVVIGAFAAVMAIGAYPLARSVTRRLERLTASVDALGRGELAARAPVEGSDEVAQLAASFNRAARRIESLVGSQRTLLAGASHELRSPLARLQVAVELLAGDGRDELAPGRRAELRERVARDVALLDAGVEELLLASRLDLADAAGTHRPLDWLALVAEECARAEPPLEVAAAGAGPRVRGDERSLRHLVRNLLANARRHAEGSPVEVTVEAEAGDAVLRVADRGPGVPEADRERIFEPFTRAGGAEGGLGLGLAIVRHVARHHGGEARVFERAGGGSLFEVRLPLDLS